MRCVRHFAAVALVTPLVFAPSVAGGDWSRFRGPNGSGSVEASGMPVEFGPQKGVDWVAEVPFGRSSPVLTEHRVYLTATAGDELLTLALDRATGREVWRRSLPRAYAAEMHSATDSSTPTPVTDGVNVYAFFHETGLVSYDDAGNLRWRAALGPFRNFYSVAASPILVGDVVVQLCDQARGSSFIAGFHKNTGEQLWRRDRPARAEAYSTPVVVAREGGSSAVLVLGSKWIDAYDAYTGADLWTFQGVGSGPVASPTLVGDMLFVAAPDQAAEPLDPFATLLATHDDDGDGRLVRAELEGVWMFNHFGWIDHDGDGWLTDAEWTALDGEIESDHWGMYGLHLAGADRSPEVVWNTRQSVPYIPTLLHFDGVLYSIKGDILSTADPRTGETYARTRLAKGSGNVYASPVAADGKVYIAMIAGEMVVLEAGAEPRVLALNDLEEEIYSTPALADGELYVRTRAKLYRFGRGASVAPTEGDQPSR